MSLTYDQFDHDPDGINCANVRILDEGRIRVTYDRFCILVEELPRKPCKRRLRYYALVLQYQCDVLGLNAFLPVNLLMGSESVETYEEWVDFLEKAVAKAVASESRPKLREAVETHGRVRPEEGDRYYMHVMPADAKPFTAKGADFSFEATWTKFRAYAPGSTMFREPDMEPHYTAYVSQSAGAARKLYQLVKKDPKAFARLTWKEFSNWLIEHKIGYETQFSVWS